MATESKQAFTTGDVAHLLGTTSRTVAEMCDREEIGSFKLPRGDRRIPRASLIVYLRSIRHKSALESIGE
jgi:excisionase family DNA binding protein